jgi:hypothetical protein
MSSFPASTIKVTDIQPCGEGKVCITMQMVVDVHRLADVGSEMLHVAAKASTAAKKK